MAQADETARDAEIEALRRRVAELEEKGREFARLAAILEATPEVVSTVGADHRLRYLNPAGRRMFGYSLDDPLTDFDIATRHPPWALEVINNEAVPTALRDGVWWGETAILDVRGREVPVSQFVIVHRGPDGEVEFFSTIMRDLTERKASERALAAQSQAMLELSTPLIPINDEILVMPLIGVLDSARIDQVMDTLLRGISRARARVAILDITGVGVVDTKVAEALLRAARAVALLGAKVVLTGIRPEVAQTLVGLGTDLAGIATAGSLQAGIALAMR